MKPRWWEHVLPFALVLLAVGVVNVATGVLIHVQTGAFFVSPLGTLAQLPFALLLLLACRAIVVRVGKVPVERTPFRVEARRAAIELAIGIAVGLVVVLGLIGALAMAGLLDVTLEAPSAIRLPSALASFLIDACIQQVGLSSFAIVAKVVSARTRSPGAVALLVATAIFVLPHLPLGTSPLYPLNVALFGMLTLCITFRTERPSLAAAIGLHGGWNAAIVVCGGVHELEPGPAARLLTLTPHDVLWTGGAAGLENGLAYTLPCLLLVALAVWRRRSHQLGSRRHAARTA